MILLSINFVLVTMLKVREEQIHFWFCWCFPPTGPMHLISALSLWGGHIVRNMEDFSTPRLYQVKDVDLRAQTHCARYCQRRTSNSWANEEHGWHRIKRCRHQGPHLNQMTHLKNEPSPKGKIGSYPYLSFLHSLFPQIIDFP